MLRSGRQVHGSLPPQGCALVVCESMAPASCAGASEHDVQWHRQRSIRSIRHVMHTEIWRADGVRCCAWHAITMEPCKAEACSSQLHVLR
jgi:hypothetical protein